MAADAFRTDGAGIAGAAENCSPKAADCSPLRTTEASLGS
jgi:hypothetical protein